MPFCLGMTFMGIGIILALAFRTLDLPGGRYSPPKPVHLVRREGVPLCPLNPKTLRFSTRLPP